MEGVTLRQVDDVPSKIQDNTKNGSRLIVFIEDDDANEESGKYICNHQSDRVDDAVDKL